MAWSANGAKMIAAITVCQLQDTDHASGAAIKVQARATAKAVTRRGNQVDA